MSLALDEPPSSPFIFTEFRGARKCPGSIAFPPSLPQSSLDRGGGSAAAPMSGGRTIKFMVWALGPPRSVADSWAKLARPTFHNVRDTSYFCSVHPALGLKCWQPRERQDRKQIHLSCNPTLGLHACSSRERDRRTNG